MQNIDREQLARLYEGQDEPIEPLPEKPSRWPVVGVLVLIALVIGLLFTLPAKSAEGVGVACDTQEQAEQVLQLTLDGLEPQAVFDIVNGEAGHNACGMLHLIFTPAEVISATVQDGVQYVIIKMNVHAIIFNGARINFGSHVQYTLYKEPVVQA